MADEKITLSAFTADVGGFVGHTSSHPDVLDAAKERLYVARSKKTIEDFHVLRCGDDLELLITHREGASSRTIHELAWNTFVACRREAEALKLYASGRGMLDEFAGNVCSLGPGCAEIEFSERASDPVIVLFSNKTSSGSWNLPVYRIFADPFNSPGLICDPAMLEGFVFTLLDMKEAREIDLYAPEEANMILALSGTTSRFVIQSVRKRNGEPAAVVASQKYDVIGGRPAAPCEPALIVRCQDGLPATGEVMEAFTLPHLVAGWLRLSYMGPLMPVPFYEANPTRFDGPPRVIAAGFQLSGGRLIGPHDMFDDPSFDEARRTANTVAEYLRRHGPFQPHRLPPSELHYTSLPIILDRVKDRARKIR